MSELGCAVLVLIILVRAVQTVQVNRTSSTEMWAVWAYKARARKKTVCTVCTVFSTCVCSQARVCAHIKENRTPQYLTHILPRGPPLLSVRSFVWCSALSANHQDPYLRAQAASDQDI